MCDMGLALTGVPSRDQASAPRLVLRLLGLDRLGSAVAPACRTSAARSILMRVNHQVRTTSVLGHRVTQRSSRATTVAEDVSQPSCVFTQGHLFERTCGSTVPPNHDDPEHTDGGSAPERLMTVGRR